MDDKLHSVFFEILAMACVAICRSLSGFSHGFGRMAESTYAYFGQALSNATRRRLWAKITGSNKEGIATHISLRERQCRLFKSCTALIFAFNNYQRGLHLQHQRGEHTSAFFKGTHQCAHKVFPFADCTFVKMYAAFT